MDDDPPDFEIIAGFYFENWIVGVGGTKFYVAFRLVGEVEILHREFAVPKSNNNRTVVWVNRFVNNYAVTIEDAGIFHRIAFYITIE